MFYTEIILIQDDSSTLWWGPYNFISSVNTLMALTNTIAAAIFCFVSQDTVQQCYTHSNWNTINLQVHPQNRTNDYKRKNKTFPCFYKCLIVVWGRHVQTWQVIQTCTVGMTGKLFYKNSTWNQCFNNVIRNGSHNDKFTNHKI